MELKVKVPIVQPGEPKDVSGPFHFWNITLHDIRLALDGFEKLDRIITQLILTTRGIDVLIKKNVDPGDREVGYTTLEEDLHEISIYSREGAKKLVALLKFLEVEYSDS